VSTTCCAFTGVLLAVERSFAGSFGRLLIALSVLRQGAGVGGVLRYYDGFAVGKANNR
jgi:hypothetical protein